MSFIAAVSLIFILLCSWTPLSCGEPERRANFTLEELYNLQSRIFDHTIALESSINSSLLAPNIRGRVDITRQFTGSELNTEYLFGLFAQLNITRAFTLLGIPTAYAITHFTGFRDVASSATLMNFTSPFWGAFTLEIHVWTQFDARGRAAQYEATFRHWDLFVDEALARVARARFDGSLPATLAYAADALARTICRDHEVHCAGADRQYESEEGCYEFLTKGVPFGKPHEMGLDTLLCRMVHDPMVALRPGVHCPHIGPGGGDMCTDALTYGERIDQAFWEGPWMPEW